MGRPCRCCKGPQCCCSPWVINYDPVILWSDCILEPLNQNVSWHLSNFNNTPNGNIGGSFVFPPSRNCVPDDGTGLRRDSISFVVHKVINLSTATYVKAQLIGDVERTLGDKDLHQLSFLKMKDNSGLTGGEFADMGLGVQEIYPDARYGLNITNLYPGLGSWCCETGFCDDGRPLSDYDNYDDVPSDKTFTKLRGNGAPPFISCHGTQYYNYGGNVGWESLRPTIGGEYWMDVWGNPYGSLGTGTTHLNIDTWPSCISQNLCPLSVESNLCSNTCDNVPKKWALGTLNPAGLFEGFEPSYDHQTVRQCYRTIYTRPDDSGDSVMGLWQQIYGNIGDILYYDKPPERKHMSGFHLNVRSDRCHAGCGETAR